MASTEIVKTVHIETGGGERSVKSLREEIRQLRDALLNMDQGGEEWVATAQQLTQAQNDLNTVMRAGKGDLDATSDSIAGMEAQYKSLYNTYKLLGSEARETAEGLAMRDQLAELSNNINNAKQSVGNFKSNIGNYSKSIMDAFNAMGKSVGGLNGPLKAAGTSVKSFGAALKSLAANPVGAVTMAVVIALKALNAIAVRVKKAIAQNEDYQKRMNKAMAAFKPIGDMVARVMDRIAGVVVKVAEGAARVVSWFHKLVPAANELNEAEQQIVDTENELIETRREVQVLNSEDEAEVQTLWEQASATEDVKEKQELLAQAKAKQEEINKRNVELAQKELDLLILQSSVRPNSIEDNDKIAQAQANLNNAIANGERAIRRLNNAGRSARSSARRAADDTKDELDEILKRLEDNSKTEIQVLTEKYEEEKKLLEKYHKDTTKLTKEYEENLAKIRVKYEVDSAKLEQQLFEQTIQTYVQPSSRAYSYLIARAEDIRDAFISTLAGEGVKYDWEKNNFIVSSLEDLFEDAEDGVVGRKLKEAFAKLDMYYGMGIQESLDKAAEAGASLEEMAELVYVPFGVKLQEMQANVRDLDKAFYEWVINNGKRVGELELQAKEFEQNSIISAFGKGGNELSLMQRLEGFKEIWEAQYDFYYDRVKTAKELWEDVNNVYQEAYETALGEGKDKYRAMRFAEDAINNLGYTYDEMLALQGDYYDAQEELRQFNLEREAEYTERMAALKEQETSTYFNLGKTAVSTYGTIYDSISKIIEVRNKEGKYSEKETEKKKKQLETLEKIQLAVAIAGIAADAASSIMGVWNSYSKELVLNAETAAATGPAAVATKAALDAKSLTNAILRTTALGAQAVAASAAASAKTVSNLNNIAGLGDSSSAAASAVPERIDSTPYSYTRQIQTDSEREQELNRPVYVRVTDINNVQNRVKVIENEATF